jgi:ribokinase
MITVVGSLNMDIVLETDLPKQGETIFGKSFFTLPGGKGANQAVAVSRLNGNVQMIGCVGEDSFGKELLTALQKEGIQTNHVQSIQNVPTGVATILLSEGDNRIIVTPGANYHLTPERIDQVMQSILQSQLVILQLEIPTDTVLKVLQICHSAGIPILLNPAPASGFLINYINYATFITPNETECEEIFGIHYEQALEKYPNQLIVTLGKKGAQYFDGKEHIFIQGFETKAVDTTGAGDTFNGAFAFAISQKYTIKNAVQFANAAASLSVEKLGAQGGMPSFDHVVERLKNRR